MKQIETPIVITTISARQDGSLRFSCETPEYTSEEKTSFLDLQGKNLTAIFTPVDEAPTEEIKVEKEMDLKSPAERLRAVMYVYFREKNPDAGVEEFPVFYRKAMEKIIDTYKEKLS